MISVSIGRSSSKTATITSTTAVSTTVSSTSTTMSSTTATVLPTTSTVSATTSSKTSDNATTTNTTILKQMELLLQYDLEDTKLMMAKQKQHLAVRSNNSSINFDGMLQLRNYFLQDEDTSTQPFWYRMIAHLNSVTDLNLPPNNTLCTSGKQEENDNDHTMPTCVHFIVKHLFKIFGVFKVLDEQEEPYFDIFCDILKLHLCNKLITENQVYGYIVCVLYYQLCTKPTFTNPWDPSSDTIEVSLLVLNFSKMFHPSLLKLFAQLSDQKDLDFLAHILNTIKFQTCNCAYHATYPRAGPQYLTFASIPSYDSLQKEIEASQPKGSPEILFVDTVIHILMSMIHGYYTPFLETFIFDENDSAVATNGTFCLEEKAILMTQIRKERSWWPPKNQQRGLLRLEKLKQSCCPCEFHSHRRGGTHWQLLPEADWKQ